MSSTTVPTESVRAELDGLIAEADALDVHLGALIDHIDQQIARLEAMNPAQVAALAAFADLRMEGLAA